MADFLPAGGFRRFHISSGWEPVETHVPAERAVALSVNGQEWLSFTCTPNDLDALAAGFLFNEGVIAGRDELAAVDVCRQGTLVDVWLNRTVERPDQWRRTSGCSGGQTSVSAQPAGAGPSAAGWEKLPVHPLAVVRGMEQLLEAQELYRESGGIHCSALSDGERLLLRAEDIGRHNTLDKLAGRMLLDGLQTRPLIVLTTGRISSEMLQKSARMGAGVVASRTSPTSQSVQMASELGIVLAGYTRRTGFIVYTHAERLSG